MKRLNHEKSISDILSYTSKKIFKKKGFHLFKLIDSWDAVVGKLAENSEPKLLKSQQGKQILEINIYNPALLIEFQYGKAQILEDINSFFGEEIVQDIRTNIISPDIQINNKKEIQKTLENNPQIIADIAAIEDEDIRKSLEIIFSLKKK